MFQLFFFGFFIDFHHIWEMECCKLCEIESHFERGKGNGRVTVRVRVTVKEGWWKSFWGSVRVTFLEGGWWESLWRWESLWEREGESHFERGRVRVTLREGEPLWEEESERERERESESHFEGGRVRVRGHDMLENQQWLLFWHKYMFQERSHTLTSHNWTATWHTDTNTSLDHTHIMAKKCNT